MDANQQQINPNTPPTPDQGRFQHVKEVALAVGLSVLAACGVQPSHEVHTASPVVAEALTTPVEATTTTLETSYIRSELLPNQEVGTITLHITGKGTDGSGPKIDTISLPLTTDGRTREQVDKGVPGNPDDPNLMNGFVLHVDTSLPGDIPLGKEVKHWVPTIGAHRITPVADLSQGPLYDIDKLNLKDKMEITLSDGRKAVYEKMESGLVLENTPELQDVLFQETDKDELLIYGCSHADGSPGGREARAWAKFVRVE